MAGGRGGRPVQAFSNAGIAPVNRNAVYPTDYSNRRPLTRAERTNFLETSRYEDVVSFIDSLKLLGAQIATGSIGTTTQGRAIPYVIASRPLVHNAEEAKRLNRPIVYIESNIHSGEVEGKETMLSMLRELVFQKTPNVLDSLVLVVVPDYNADGNENVGKESRLGSQDGPVLTGTRENSQGINLNRDYVKAEAPETRGSFAMFNAWDPDVFIDNHTTDGSMFGYALTYSPPLNPAAISTMAFTMDTLLPAVRRNVLTRERMQMFDYGNYNGGAPTGEGGEGGGGGAGGRAGGRGRGGAAGGAAGAGAAGGGAAGGGAAGAGGGAARGGGGRGAPAAPGGIRAWRTYEDTPRYGTNYYGLRGRIAILSEAYSHDPFLTRIKSNYAFVGEILSLVAANREKIMDISHEADRKTIAGGTTPSAAPLVALRTTMTRHPRTADIIVEDLGRLADTAQKLPGVARGYQRINKFHTEPMQIFDRFEATLERRMPVAYAFGPEQRSLVAQLALHGVSVEQLADTLSVRAERFVVDSVIKAPRPFEANAVILHNTVRLEGRWESAPQTLRSGTYIVREGQPLGVLAMFLLEPESSDGLATWNFLDAWLEVGKSYPVLRVTEPFNTNAPLRQVKN